MKNKIILTGSLTCKCKGFRKYVHGTDIYNLFFKELSVNRIFSNSFEEISISFKKIITSKTIYYEIYTSNVKDKEANVIVSFISNNKKYCAILKSAEDTVKEAYSFNESDIVKHCLLDLDNKKITLLKKVKFTPIEIFTAMNKKLLNSLFPPDKSWLMTKFESAKYYDNLEHKVINMIVKKNVLLKLVKTDIYTKNDKIGSISFSKSE
jgi:hypothetical protein